MCLLALHFRCLPASPVLVAANREEFYDRDATPPEIQPGAPQVLCGIDLRAGGTWLGVNQHGLLVAVTNRRHEPVPRAARSRGLLCRELLDCAGAEEASEMARRELNTGRYAGANYLCADRQFAAVVRGGSRPDSLPLDDGLHLLTNGDVDDDGDPRQALARGLFDEQPVSTVDEYLAAAAAVCGRGPTADQPGIVLRFGDRGTVSSTLVALSADPGASRLLHAPGPPDKTPYADYSHLLREVLQGGT